METEWIKIFDEHRNEIGVASREDVHRLGYWHEVCHCWFVSRENGVDYIYLQRRSLKKKENPGLLDITAAGHLLADETVYDSVREIKEELGIEVKFAELLSLGQIDYHVTSGTYIDNEIANVFLYIKEKPFEDFLLQEEEVLGMMKTRFTDFADLWSSGGKDQIFVTGYEISENGEELCIEKAVERDAFVQHPVSYYQTIICRMRDYIER